jgi:hypothetical protein
MITKRLSPPLSLSLSLLLLHSASSFGYSIVLIRRNLRDESQSVSSTNYFLKTTMHRPTTPPLTSYLLTPPSTGGFVTRDGFVDAKRAKTTSRCLSKFIEGESADAFFEEIQEDSDIELSESEESISTTSSPSSASHASDTSVGPETSVDIKHDSFSVLSTVTRAPPVTEPFPLLRLPLSIRNKIYEHLLAVLGLVCVRQKQTSSHAEDEVYLHADPHQLLPGIAQALAQLTVDGYKIRFSRFACANINILLTSKEVYTEAKAVLYSKNNFAIVRPSAEMAPPPDFSVHLFPPGCQRLIANLSMRIRSFYDLHWLLSTGYNAIKNFYRGLRSLTLILELQSAKKGFGRQWAKKQGEKWNVYVKRLQIEIAKDSFVTAKGKTIKRIPTWINLRVLFTGEGYDEKFSSVATTVEEVTEQAGRDELRHALVEAWELFKKGGR